MKNVIFFGLGAALGSIVTVFCVKRHYRKLADEEIDEVREAYRKKTVSKELAERNSEAKKAILRDISSEKEPENEAKLVKLTEKSEDLKRFEELREPYVESHNVFSNPLNEEEFDDFEEDTDDPYEIFVDHTSPSELNSQPFEISEEEFASEKLFYDKVMLFYYNDGIAVMEDTDEIIDALEDLIGPDIIPEAIERLGDYPSENDTVYVRNDNRSTDYGIIFTGTEFVQEEEPD